MNNIDINDKESINLTPNKRRKILRVGIIFALMVAIIISVCFIYSLTKKEKDKSLREHFFSKTDETIISELSYQDGKSIQVDEYTFTLDSVIYDSSTLDGFCLFIIGAEDKKLSKKFYEDVFSWKYLITLGHYDRSGDKTEVEIHDGKIYLYYEFATTSVDFDHCVYVYDLDVSKDYLDAKDAVASFPLKEQFKNKMFQLNDGVEVKVSPFSLFIGDYPEKYDSFSINYKNGKQDKYYEKGRMVNKHSKGYSGFEGGTDKGITKLIKIGSEQPMNIDNIDYIMVDDVKYYPTQ